MDRTPHPIAKIFAPIVFSSLALLSVGMAFGPAQADEPSSATETLRVEVSAPADPS